MRFLVVDKRQAADAQILVGEAVVDDVEVVVVGKGRHEDHERLSQVPPGSRAVLFNVSPKRIKDYELVVEHSVASMVIARATLVPWMRGESSGAPGRQAEPTPRAAFDAAATREPRLILTEHALDDADQLPADRFRFANASAKALEEFARTGRALPSVDGYFLAKGLHLARTGRTKYAVNVMASGVLAHSAETEWHLSQGQNTSGAHAARIYFYKFVWNDLPYVAVLHVGPHPDDYTTHTVTILLP